MKTWPQILAQVRTLPGLLGLITLVLSIVCTGLAANVPAQEKGNLLWGALGLLALLIISIVILFRNKPATLSSADNVGYDEITNLRKTFAKRGASDEGISTGGTPTLQLLLEKAARSSQIKEWAREDKNELMTQIARHCDEEEADCAFWWLIVEGVLAYEQIEIFQNSDDDGEPLDAWSDNIDLVHLSHRGIALLNGIDKTK